MGAFIVELESANLCYNDCIYQISFTPKKSDAIDLSTIDELIRPTHEWGGAYVVITSDENEVFDPERDEVYWADKRPLITYVVTKHAKRLSGLFEYVKMNILESRDAFLYGFLLMPNLLIVPSR